VDYQCDDADAVIVSMGPLGKEAEVATDMLRKEGIRAGSLLLCWLRPFPKPDLKGKERIVLDRDYSFGFGGIPAPSIRAQHKTDVYSVIAGLGGEKVMYEDSADFIRKRCMGKEYWFEVNDQV